MNSVASLASEDDFDMFLEPHKKYILMLMWQEVIEGTIVSSEDDWFYIQVGKRTRQFYYWDVDYGYPAEIN